MNEQVSVCIVGVYFGKMPSYFPLWVRSASWNKDISFKIITDQELANLPENITTVSMTLEDFRNLANQKLGFQTAINRPYKCCDFKPAYGLILSDYLTGFDYWAHCDFDLIFGDIRRFLVDYRIDKYDKFLDLGHLSFYRNTYENNTRFMLEGSKCGNYREVYSSENSYAFDELSGIYSIFQKNRFPTFDGRIYADISKIHKRFTLATCNDNFPLQIFIWSSGKVFRKYIGSNNTVQDNEFMYIHFKERGQLPFKEECLNSDEFIISNCGFFPLAPNKDVLQLVKIYNPYRGWVPEKIEDIRYKADIEMVRIKRRFGRFK